MSAPDLSDAGTTVDFVLQSRRLPVTGDEREWLIRNLPLLALAAERIRLPDVRYGEPALVYTAKSPRTAGDEPGE